MWGPNHYDKRYKRRPVNLLPYAELWISLLYGVASERPGSIVDLACGFGMLTRMLAALCGAQVTGIDFSRVALRNARQGRDGALSPSGEPLPRGSAKFVLGDFMTAEIPPADVCVANQVIEHMDDDRAAVARALEIAPVLWAAVPREGKLSPMHVQSYDATAVRSRFSPLGRVTLVPHVSDRRWILFSVRK